MDKIKMKLNGQFGKIKNKINSPEADYWKERLLGQNQFKFNLKTLSNLAARFAVWLIVFFFLLFAWFAKDMPTPGNIKNHQSASATQLFDRNGKQIYSFYGDVKRVKIESNEIPQSIKNATITAEDRSFYRHLGVDAKGILRSVYYNITNKKGYVSGGSTITQQYVKNALLDRQKTLTRKIKELILSIEVEILYNKDQILTMYLNEIPYGSNAYGIEAASETFFNKHANELTLAESATLAALPQRPTYFSPYGTHPDQRIARAQWILDSMADLNYISKDEATKAKEEAKNIKFAEPHQYIVAPHFAMYVKEQLIDEYGEQMVNEGGLKVTTTLDLDKQVMAEDAVKEAAQKRFDNINASNAAQVSIDPKTGQVLSMVGSADFFNADIDGQVNVADSQRQPGSSFKPIVYAAAFKDKYNPATILWDVRTDFGGYVPQNYNGNFNGPVTMRQALAGSLNIPAVKALYLAGMDNALNTAHSMGITTLNDRDRYGLSLVLGGGEVKLIDLVTAYGVFANNGKLAETTTILKVEDGRGRVLKEYKENTKEVLDPQIAYQISSILSDNGARSYVFGGGAPLAFYDRQVAVKTGTTSEYRDAWTVGYTPQLVSGVWVGNNDNRPMSAGAAGAMAAAPIWRSYMNKALASQPVENFIRPNGISDVTVDKLSNKLPTDNSPETITDIFARWQVPNSKDDVHQKIRIDKATGLRATDNCPDSATEYKVYTVLHSEQPNNPAWENPVLAAAADFGINVGFPPTQTSCSKTQTESGSLVITSPSNNANVEPDFTVKVSVKSKNIKEVDLYIDNKKVGTDKSDPFQFSVKNLAQGWHEIKAIGNGISSETIFVSVNGTNINETDNDTSGPGNATNISVTSGSGSATINWRNPSDNDLKSVYIYQSQTDGSIGQKVATYGGATPSANASIKISGLNSGETYWFTIRPADKSDNENTSTTQYQVTVL